MFRFQLLLIVVYGVQRDFMNNYLSSIDDTFQGEDAIIMDDAYSYDEYNSRELMLQAETLLFDQSPLIEQMLAMASSIGDSSEESQMIMLIDNNDLVPDYAVLQSPISDTKVLQQTQNSRPKVEQMITDEPEWLAQTEFFLGALLVFASFPLLLHVESRKYKNHMILRDVSELKDKEQIVFIQGSTIVSEEYLIDPVTGIRVNNALRLYRKVEELLMNNNGDRKWIEREGDIQWYDEVDNEIGLSCWVSRTYSNICQLDNYQINENQLSKLEQWVRLPLNQLHYPDYEIENNNIYIVNQSTLKISYWYIPSQLLTIICKSYGNQLNPIEIHLPIIESTCLDETCQSNTRGCQEPVCQKVFQWINWGEWSQDECVIDYIEEGLLTIDDIFQKRLSFYKVNVWITRIAAFLLMLVGIWMFFLPIYQVLTLFPVFGQLDIGPYLGGLVGLLFAMLFCLLTIGVSYCFYKRLVGLVLIAMAIGICVVLIICTHFDIQIDTQGVYLFAQQISRLFYA